MVKIDLFYYLAYLNQNLKHLKLQQKNNHIYVNYLELNIHLMFLVKT